MTFLLIGIFLAAVTLGAIVWIRNTQHRVYQSFFALCITGGLWTLTNALFFEVGGVLQYVDALVSYAVMGLFATAFVIFCKELTNNTTHQKAIAWAGVIGSIISAFPGLVSSDVQNNAIITTPFIFIYAACILLFFATGIFYLIRGYKSAGSVRRRQITLVLVGIVITFSGASVCNLILPLFGDYRFVSLGPVFSVVFLFFFAYTIVKHQLFDIKRTLTRFLAHAASVTVLGGLVGYCTYWLFTYGSSSVSMPFLFIVSGMVVAALFPITKKVFDFVTKRIFFSSEYDTQKAIDTMTGYFAKSSTLRDLEHGACRKLEEIVGSLHIRVTYTVPPEVLRSTKEVGRKFIIKDFVENISENEPLLSYMQKNAISVCVLLTVHNKIIGTLNFSDKANGTFYTAHDIEFINIISDSFAIALQNAQRFSEIQLFNVELQDKIKEATDELRQTNKRLRAIDASKDEFISMASHQLRTPLTSIKGYISMLLEGDLGRLAPAQRKALEEAYNSSQRMVYLIGDFLNLSRLQTGRFEIERSRASLPRIIEEEIAQLRATAQARGVTLRYDAPTDFPSVLIDETKIRQVMMNFIDNAIYYSKPTGGEVVVLLDHTVGGVVFQVKDNGIGVAASDRHELFTKFYRTATARKARPDGTGIGLYMAKKVVDAHGGAIIFESKENVGSTFGFRLPLTQ